MWTPHAGSSCQMHAGLERLAITQAALEELPPALAAAKHLTRLDISQNPELVLDQSAVDVLLQMPHLQQIELAGAGARLPALLRLAREHPRLRISPTPDDLLVKFYVMAALQDAPPARFVKASSALLV